MRGAGDHFSVGDRIAFYRRRRVLTQRVLAELVGRSEDWLSKVERNEREVRRLDVISDLARALRVSVGDLLGQPVLVEDTQPKDEDVPAVRDALMSHRRLSQTLFGSRAVEDIAVEPVVRFSDHAWTNYQQGRLGRVIAALPNLIKSAQALEEASLPDDPRPWRASARIHHLAATTLAKIGEADLSWIAAERAMSAAERSGDPLSLASAARAGTHALLAVGRFDDAVNLGQTAADWLAKYVDQDDPAALSIAGMLHLRTAIAAAHRQDRSTATTPACGRRPGRYPSRPRRGLLADQLRPDQRAAAPRRREPGSWRCRLGGRARQPHRRLTPASRKVGRASGRPGPRLQLRRPRR